MSSPARVPLELLRIESPCPADWGAMAGDDRRRFCAGCRKHVHNLAAMTRAEAERLVCASAGELCVRLTRAADGTVVTMDYEPARRGKRRPAWWRWTGVGLVGAVLASVANALYGPPPRRALGGMAMAGGLPPGGWYAPPPPPAAAPATAVGPGTSGLLGPGPGCTVTSADPDELAREMRNVLPSDAGPPLAAAGRSGPGATEVPNEVPTNSPPETSSPSVRVPVG